MTIAYIAIGAAVLLIGWAVYTYNFMIHARNKVGEAFSGIDVQLRKRHDLVPNLVETVRGYADHEHGAFESVTVLRNQAIAVQKPKAIERVENKLAAEMHKLIALVERYPNLRADEQFKKLMAELTDVENEIQSARALYNANVQFFNSRAQSFPTLLIASRMTPASYPFLEFEYVETDASKLVAGEFAA